MDVCPICYEELNENIAIDCGHQFHHDCIYEWLKHQQNCPLCRHDTVIPVDKRLVVYDPEIESVIVPYDIPEVIVIPDQDFYHNFDHLDLSRGTLQVFATSYNMIRIMSGMSGLSYS
jgi:hypothetical protein